jgi:hypothetical protein
VAVYNSNASRLSEPVRLRLSVQYRDLARQQPVCPFDCSGRGRCSDPASPLPGVRGGPPRSSSSSILPGSIAERRQQATAAAAASLSLDTAGQLALGPLQDQSPLDAGFMCTCAEGFGGLLCEGRVHNVTVGSGEQRLGPDVLPPGEWAFFVTTIDGGFNPATNDLGVHWIVGQPASAPSNYTNAYISFDQGPTHRWVGG